MTKDEKETAAYIHSRWLPRPGSHRINVEKMGLLFFIYLHKLLREYEALPVNSFWVDITHFNASIYHHLMIHP